MTEIQTIRTIGHWLIKQTLWLKIHQLIVLGISIFCLRATVDPDLMQGEDQGAAVDPGRNPAHKESYIIEQSFC